MLVYNDLVFSDGNRIGISLVDKELRQAEMDLRKMVESLHLITCIRKQRETTRATVTERIIPINMIRNNSSNQVHAVPARGAATQRPNKSPITTKKDGSNVTRGKKGGILRISAAAQASLKKSKPNLEN